MNRPPFLLSHPLSELFWDSGGPGGRETGRIPGRMQVLPDADTPSLAEDINKDLVI